MPRQRTAYLAARYSLAILFVCFGAMSIIGVSSPNIDQWVSSHSLFSNLFSGFNGSIHYIVGSVELIAGLIIALPKISVTVRKLGYTLVILYSVSALSLLFTNPVWVSDLGGFPAIGSGQGLLKYITILGVAVWILQYTATPWQRGSSDSFGFFLIVMGIVTVMVWIGAMKFTEIEAKGIEPLLKSSYLFSWMLGLFEIQVASYIIGIVEIFAALCLLCWALNRTLLHLGLMLCFVTFISTLSFLITFENAWAGSFPYLANAGHFLMKDLVLLMGSFILLAEDKQRR